MHLRKHSDQGFDDFRRERKRMRAKLGSPTTVLGYENPALRELEQVEAKEIMDQRLTREVHEFFASATRQAAGIVEKVSRDAQQEAGARVEQQMEAFLIDALARMNSFIVTVLQQRRPQVAETRMEPKVGNMVGATLDEFRWEGTAEVGDKHIGQDPFATDVDEVQREFRAQMSAAGGEAADPVPIDEHLVAEVQDEATDVASEDEPEAAEPEALDEPDAEPEIAELPPAPAEPRRTTAATQPPVTERERATAASAAPPGQRPPLMPKGTPQSPQEELDRLKTALKTLVRHGTLTREEAHAAWLTRLQAMGYKS